MVNTLQGREQAAYRLLTGATSGTWEQNAMEAWRYLGITENTFNGTYIKYLQRLLSSNINDLSGLIALRKRLYGNKYPEIVINPNLLFGSNCQLWLDAGDTRTITSAANAVSQWADKSANGYHATQGTGARQPTTNLNKLNGLNVLNFDGGDDMSVNSALGAIMGGANTCWIVARRTTEAGTSNRIFTMSTTGVSNYSVDYSSTAGSVFARHNNNSTGVLNTGNTNTNFQLIRFRRNGTTQAVSVNNNTAVSNTSAANIATVNEVTIGALVTSGRLTGDIAEIVMTVGSYDATSAQNLRLQQYMRNKWGLTIA